MSFVRYRLPIGSRALADRLLAEHGTLVVPGECFGLEQHFRCSTALPAEVLRGGLARINQLAGELV